MKPDKEAKDRKDEEFERVEVETDNKVLKIQHFIYNNSKKISYISVGLIVIVVLVFLLKNTILKNSDEDRQKAIVALSRILPYYEAPDFKKALFGDSSKLIRGERIIGLLEIVDEYSGTNQSKLAALYAGNSYLSLNKAVEAIEYFEIATDSPSKIVLEGGYGGLGACYEILGKTDEAVEYYEKASEISISDESIARYSYYAARNYEKMGDKENAVKIYETIINKNKFTEFANYSKAGLVRLGMKID